MPRHINEKRKANRMFIPQGKYLEIAQQNQNQSPLLRLPTEIRLTIFEYVFEGEEFVFGHRDKLHIDIRPKGEDRSKNKFNKVKLLEVCQQIYAETRLLPFKNSTFVAKRGLFRINMWDYKFTIEQRKTIRKVDVEVKAIYLDTIEAYAAALYKPHRLVQPVLPGITRVHVLIEPRKVPDNRKEYAKRWEDAVALALGGPECVKKIVATHEFLKSV